MFPLRWEYFFVSQILAKYVNPCYDRTSMLLNKYPYKTIERIEKNGRRFYQTPYGDAPSVTTVLSATKSQESTDKLENWKRSVGERAAKEIVTEAAGRGTRMHAYLEGYVISGELKKPGTNPYSIQGHRMAEVIVNNGLTNVQEFWGTEISLCHGSLYAGTTDLIGVFNNKPAILDFKQTNKPKKREWIEDYFYQLVAYAMAHNEMYNTTIDQGVILMCSKDFEYQQFVLEGEEFQQYSRDWWKKIEFCFLEHPEMFNLA